MMTQPRTLVLQLVECANCGVPFGITEVFEKRRREDNKTFYCPHGHQNVYVESQKEKLERALQQERQRHDQTKAELHDRERRLRAGERKLRAAKGQLTKVKNRVQHGVCPCCNRTFQNLQRHMKTQHPDFASTNH